MTGIPSIVAGLFVLAFWVLIVTPVFNDGRPGYSGFAAALALAVLMLPTVVRSTEEMLRLVPAALREGAYALGVPKWKTIMRIVLPTALPGIVTGVMLAIARAAGETAPGPAGRRRQRRHQLQPVPGQPVVAVDVRLRAGRRWPRSTRRRAPGRRR